MKDLIRRLLLVSSIVCAPGLAAAQEKPTVIAVPVGAGANVSSAVQQQFDSTFRRALAAHVKVAGGKATKQALDKASVRAAKCNDAICMRKIAVANQVRFVVTASVINEDEIYKVTVAVFDNALDKATATHTEICELCAVPEVDDSFSKAIEGVKDAFARPRPAAPKPPPAAPPKSETVELQVRSEPAGASVRLDGEAVGVTPLSRATLAPGQHSLEIAKEGYETELQTVTKLADQPVSLQVSLKVIADHTARAPVESQPMERTGDYAPWAWGTIGLGVVLAGTAAYLIALEGEVTCDDGRGRTECPNVYDTKWLGSAAFGVGGAALAVGVTLLILDPGGIPVGVAPSEGGGATFSWSGAF